MVQQRCPMCGMMMGNQPMQAPGMQNLSEIRGQIQHLQQRLDELEQGKVSPQGVQQEMQRMCPMCQGMMSGMGAAPSNEDVATRFEQQIQELNQRVAQLEQGRRSSTG